MSDMPNSTMVTTTRWLLIAACAVLWPTLTQAQNPPAKAAICVDCHGPNGNATIAANPILAGQTSRYLYLQMRDF